MPVKHPQIAVLLAAFNGMQWIEQQLASVLGQLAVEVTVFISIDPSTDGTEDWCNAYAATHPSVVVMPAAGSFGGASRNFFRLIRDVDLSRYDFIALCDQDDVWYPDKLHRAVQVLSHHGVDAYSSNVRAFWPDGKSCSLDKAQQQVAWDFYFEAAGPGCTYVLTKNLAAAMKADMLFNWRCLQDVSLHDWYCYAFARTHGYRWYIDPKPSMDYRQHGGNQVGANTGLSSMVTRYKSIHDGWWFNQVRLIARLVGQENDPFVRTWFSLGRGQLIRLSFSAFNCRRRARDKMFFFFICWATALIGKKAS